MRKESLPPPHRLLSLTPPLLLAPPLRSPSLLAAYVGHHDSLLLCFKSRIPAQSLYLEPSHVLHCMREFDRLSNRHGALHCRTHHFKFQTADAPCRRRTLNMAFRPKRAGLVCFVVLFIFWIFFFFSFLREASSGLRPRGKKKKKNPRQQTTPGCTPARCAHSDPHSESIRCGRNS